MSKRMRIITTVAVVMTVGALSVVGLKVSQAAGIGASDNVALLPSRPDVTVVRLPESRLPRTSSGAPAVTAMQALLSAEREFGLSDQQIDAGVGLVSGVVSHRGDSLHHDIKSWIVTANVETMGQGLTTRDTVYRKLCIVIDAESGRYMFAYTADAQRLH